MSCILSSVGPPSEIQPSPPFYYGPRGGGVPTHSPGRRDRDYVCDSITEDRTARRAAALRSPSPRPFGAVMPPDHLAAGGWAFLEFHRGHALLQQPHDRPLDEKIRGGRVTRDPWQASRRAACWSEDAEAILRKALEHSPDELGYLPVNWTVPLLREHIEKEWGQKPSDLHVRRELSRLKYVWKRPGLDLRARTRLGYAGDCG